MDPRRWSNIRAQDEEWLSSIFGVAFRDLLAGNCSEPELIKALAGRGKVVLKVMSLEFQN